jgi:hypothetical protein
MSGIRPAAVDKYCLPGHQNQVTTPSIQETNIMKYWIFTMVMLMAFTSGPEVEAAYGHDAGGKSGNRIQIALLLDTSNSMDGLIEQAKGKLWSVVNEFARYRKGEQTPQLEIALFEYGNDGLEQYDDWIRQVAAFTADLDFISEKLFELTTYGGSEYCGAVIRDANRKLEWSQREDDLKLIFIAGNEPFNQGRYPYRDACSESTGKGIAINTIFCGEYETGLRELWKEGAVLGKGRYINIDHNEQVSYIETPYDKDLDRLNRQLNDTYIYYGRHGREKKANQATQDENAAGYSGANAADRTVSKASGHYRNSSWDLVDAYEEAESDMDALEFDEATLPPELQGMSAVEIETLITDQQKKRSAITGQIKALNKKRQAYISQQSKSAGNTLDQAIFDVVRDLAKEKGYQTRP